LDDNIPVLPEILAKHGYKTCAVSTLYSMRKWFARGFQYYMNPVAGNPIRLQQVDADEINDMAIPWIKQNREKKFFMYVHYWDPHTIYNPPAKYKSLYYKGDPTDPNNRSLEPLKKQIVWPFQRKLLMRIEPYGEKITDLEYVIAQYDGEINYVDEKVGELLNTLEEVDVADDTMVVLTSDHGEALGEHNMFFEHGDVYEHTIRVPLIIKFPQMIPEGKKIDALVQGIDIPATILDVLGIPKPEEFEGMSLLPLINGEKEEGYSESYTSVCHWSAKRTIITKEGWKLIRTIEPGVWKTPIIELFNLKKDPEEKHNLANQEKDIAYQLDAQMSRWLQSKLGPRPDPVRLVSKDMRNKYLKQREKEWRELGDIATYEELRKSLDYPGYYDL